VSDAPTPVADCCPTCAQFRAELAAERAARRLALIELREAWLQIELLLLAHMAAWPTEQ
jgi:hypothetical protein